MIDREAVMATFDLLDYANVRWGAIHPTGKIDGGYAKTAAELADFAEAYAGWNFYVQPNPSARIGGTRARTEDITEWRWFIVDLDPIADVVPRTLTEIAHAVQAVMSGYLGHRFDDVWPVVLYSGRGIQIWYPVSPWKMLPGEEVNFTRLGGLWQSTPGFFEDSVTVTTLQTTRAITLAQRYWLGRIAERVLPKWGYAVDVSVSDLPRLARCPGTFNQKTGHLAVRFNDPVGALDGRNFLRYVPTAVYVERRGEVRTAPDGMPWQAADPFLTRRASAWLLNGEAEPGRHWGASAAARSLAEAGVGYGQIVAALEAGGAKCRPPLTDMEYIERTAREAVERVNRTK